MASANGLVPIDYGTLRANHLHGDELATRVQLRFDVRKGVTFSFDSWLEAQRCVKEMVYGTDSEEALRGKSKYHEIHVKEGNCYIGHRIAVFNPWGKNNITILCLDKDYGFHSTASGVARGRGYGRGEGQWDNPKCMEGDNQRFIQLAHQTVPGYHDDARAARLCAFLADEDYQQPVGSQLEPAVEAGVAVAGAAAAAPAAAAAAAEASLQPTPAESAAVERSWRAPTAGRARAPTRPRSRSWERRWSTTTARASAPAPTVRRARARPSPTAATTAAS